MSQTYSYENLTPGGDPSVSMEMTDMQWAGAQLSPFPELSEGQTIGRCRIIRELGRGGMGVVYLARHTNLETEVALKVLSPVIVKNSPQVAQRFIREAQLAARIRHPHVVAVLDVDTDHVTGLSYIIFEYMPGGTLRDKLRQGPLPEIEAVRVITEIAHALVVATEFNIVHRDIKPDNIMFDSRGAAKLSDLGLARVNHPTSMQMTVDSTTLGTPAYMSPTQINNPQAADAQDDIYSLGATFFECLTGKPPFNGITPFQITNRVLNNQTPDPQTANPKVSAASAKICRKMMAKEKAERYKTPQEVIDALRGLQFSSFSFRSRSTALPATARRAPSPALPTASAANERLTLVSKPVERREPRDLSWVGESIASFLILSVTAIAIIVFAKPEWIPAPMREGIARVLPQQLPAQPTQKGPDSWEAPENPLQGAIEGGSVGIKPVAPSPAPPSATDAQAPQTPQANAEDSGDFPIAPVARTEDISAFAARSIAESAVAPELRQNLIQIASVQNKQSGPNPTGWRFLFWDKSASQNVRAVTVTGQTISEIKEGFVELNRFRVAPYKAEEIIPADKLKIDSQDAIHTVTQTPELASVKLTSASYFLEKGKGNLPPVWRIGLRGEVSGKTLDLGEVRVSAESGNILELKLKLDKILR
jgi:serine/threonine protein kinase